MRTTVELGGPVIDRPLDEVFAFVSDLENSPDWGRTTKSVKDADSPDAVGAVFVEEARIMGQKVKHQSEVTGLDPPTEFSYANRFENGVTERTRITFAEVEGGTRVDFATEVEIEQVPQVFAPIVSMVIKQRIDTLLKKLESTFETPDKTVGGAVTMIAVGAILLATAGLRYLIEVFPEGEWWTVLALFAASLICVGTAGIVWRAARRGAEREDSEAEER
jgi:hypothetical protein